MSWLLRGGSVIMIQHQDEALPGPDPQHEFLAKTGNWRLVRVVGGWPTVDYFVFDRPWDGKPLYFDFGDDDAIQAAISAPEKN